MNAGMKQGLAGVDIADPGNNGLIEQQGFDRRLPVAQRLVQDAAVELQPQWFGPEFGEQGRRGAAGCVPDHSAKSAWVAQAQLTAVCEPDEVVVCRWRFSGLPVGRPAQRARHAEMHDEQSGLHLQQKVFAAPLQAVDALSFELLRCATQWPAQRLALDDGDNARADQRAFQTHAGDLDFGEFRHAGIVLEPRRRSACRHPKIEPTRGNAGPPQVSLTPTGVGLGAARPWGTHEDLSMRLAVFAAALLAATSWSAHAFADASEAQSTASAAQATQDGRPGAQDLARWFYAVLTGEIAANTGHTAAAYTELLKAARDMNSAPLFERATEVAVTAGAPEQALAAVNAWRSAQPESLKAQTWQAQLLVALGRNAEAAPAIARVMTLTPQPQRPKAILSLAPLFAQASDPAAAVALAKKSLAPYRGMPQSGLVIGLLQGRAGDVTSAFAAAEKALAADHGMTAAAALLLQTYTVNPQQADALLQPYFVAKPDDANLRLVWIQAALRQQRDGIALAQAQALSVTKPDLPEGWLILGSLQLQQDQTLRSQKSLLTYLSLVEKTGTPAANGGSARAYLALAEAARTQRDYPQAEHWLAKIPAGQDALATTLQQATILAEQNKFQAGMELLDKLPNGTPEQQRERLFARAQLYRTAKQYPQAYGVLKPGLAQFGKDPDYVYETAMMAEKAGDTAQMEALLRKIIAADSHYQPAYNALGYTLADQGKQLPEALRLVSHALKLAPGNPFVLDSLGWVQFRMGDGALALTSLEQAYAARQDPEIAAHLAEVLWHQGDKTRARKILHEAYDRSPQDDVVKAAMHRMDVRF